MKEIIYVIGHKNPDLDSICSCYAYAELKNRMDDGHEYVPAASGPVSENVEKQLALAGLKPLTCLADISPKLEDVMLQGEGFDRDQPIFDLVRTYTMEITSVIPVFEEGSFEGLLPVEDITAMRCALPLPSVKR